MIIATNLTGEGWEGSDLEPLTRESAKLPTLPNLPPIRRTHAQLPGEEHQMTDMAARLDGLSPVGSADVASSANHDSGMVAPTFDVAGRRYGATMSTHEAAELFCCSAERLQQERGRGTLPVEPLRLGRRLRWPTVLVARALGLPVRPTVMEEGR